jgi:acetyl esterase/lipase
MIIKFYKININKLNSSFMKKFMLCLLAFAAMFISASAQSSVTQLKPVTPKGSGIYEFPGKPVLPKGPDGKPMKIVPKQAPNMDYVNQKFFDVKYGSVSPTQTCDIYLPNDAKGPVPVIIDIHGGAFMLKFITSRDANEVEVANAGVKHGYAVVCINYRLSGEARFPRAVNDAKAVVRFVRANAKKYNFDPNKVIAWGGSAGGNLAALLGTSGNVKNLDGDNKENLEYPSNVQAVVDRFGPCDFLKYDAQFNASGKKTPFGSVFSPMSGETLYIGQPLKKDKKFTELANPETYIPTMDKATAPFFVIQHGKEDLNIPTVQSVNLATKLKAKLGDNMVYLELIPGAHHGDPAFSTEANFDKVFKLLGEHLK